MSGQHQHKAIGERSPTPGWLSRRLVRNRQRDSTSSPSCVNVNVNECTITTSCKGQRFLARQHGESSTSQFGLVPIPPKHANTGVPDRTQNSNSKSFQDENTYSKTDVGISAPLVVELIGFTQLHGPTTCQAFGRSNGPLRRESVSSSFTPAFLSPGPDQEDQCSEQRITK